MGGHAKAPFPYFGGKRRVADIVWPRLGDCANYIEPFCGSASMLLCRPTPGRIETINDVDCYVANFWRATSTDAEAVAAHADGPVNEADLHARHRWLVLSRESDEFRQRMRMDPYYFDARIAGWWCWGLCCWIGSGWCSRESEIDRKGGSTPALAGSDGRGQGVVRSTWDQRPDLAGWNGFNGGHSIHSKVPELSGSRGAAGRGIHSSGGPKQKKPLTTGAGGSAGVNAKGPRLGARKGGHSGTGVNAVSARRPLLSGRSERDVNAGVNIINGHNTPYLHDEKKPLLNPGGNAVSTPGAGIHGLGSDAAGNCAQRTAWLIDWFQELRDRLRTVRVCCGHWRRVCDSPSVTTRLGTTGIFLDPPYPTHAVDGSASRDGNLYASDEDGRDALDRLRDEVLAYCRERGRDPLMRIAVCGYDTDGYADLENEGWSVVAWKASGGYGNRSGGENKNAERERIWFSPACVDPDDLNLPLFAGLSFERGDT